MIFYETKVGSPGRVFPPTNRFRMPFAFSTPVQTAHAALQSFHLKDLGPDSEVRDVVVMLTTHFDPFQSTTSGEIEVEFQRPDSSRGGFLIQSNTIEAEIRILVIGI
jgi:hypothetical protein